MRKNKLLHRILQQIGMIALTALLGAFLGATLVRLAPGFGVDERELDTRRSESSLQALRESRASQSNIFDFYGRYLGGLLRGDLGISQSLNRPVLELLQQRLPVTFASVSVGLLVGWGLALALAIPAVISRVQTFDLFATVVSGVFLCLPSAVLAMAFLWFGAPGPLAIGLVVFPKVFRYARNLMAQTYTRPHVLAARARGAGGFRILLRHVLPVTAPELLALAGVSVSLAFGAAIPIEVICDSPGIGQLAWQAALARDLNLLVNLTLLVTLVTLVSNSAADVAAMTLEREPA